MPYRLALPPEEFPRTLEQGGASERDEFLRAAWRALVAGNIPADRLVFVDEMGSNTSLASLHAWAARGERARCSTTAQPRQEHDPLGEHDG